MKTESSETVGRISSSGSGGTNSSQPQKPKPTRAQAGTNRGDLELDRPLDRIPPPVFVSRGGATWPSNPKDVRRSFLLNTTVGFIMIAILVFGSIFGVIFSVVETHGAFATVGQSTTSTSPGTPAPSVVTTLVPSSFSTLVPSSFSTLVPSEITIYVQSEATTLITSDVMTLVPSVITLAQRDATTPPKVANISPTTLVKKRNEVSSTTGLTMSVTTTVTVADYSTTFGRYDLQSDLRGTRDSTAFSRGTPSTFVISTLSTISVSLLDLNFTNATTAMPDSAAITTLTTINAPDATIDKATITYSMMCTVADVSSLLPCNPVPTGWYISPSPPRATSFLHPVFRFISSCLFRIRDTGIYQFLRLSATAAWNRYGNAFLNAGGGKLIDSILSLVFRRNLDREMLEHIGQLGKTTGRPHPSAMRRGA